MLYQQWKIVNFIKRIIMSDLYSARPLPHHPRFKACWGGLYGGTGVIGCGGKTSFVAYKVTSAEESGNHIIVVLIVVFLVLCGHFFSTGS